MRIWLAEKKQILVERTESKQKSQDDDKESEDVQKVVNEKVSGIVKKITDKA